MKDKIIIIAGPTASGKTELSLKISKAFNGEIISADSMQIYKQLEIGTAKITKDEMQGIPHHMVSCMDICDDFSVSLYQKQALACCRDIISRGKTPIFAGGTGLYINSILYDLDFTDAKPDTSYRQELEKYDAKALHYMLKEADEASAQRIHPNDKKRIIRRLEIIKNGESEEYDFRKKSARFNAAFVGITMDRSVLYDRINRRVDIMMEKGLEKEAKTLYDNYGSALISMQAIGYKELIEYFNGKISLFEAVEKIKQNSRRYAKRQLTWLRREEDICWFDKTKYSYDDEKMFLDIKNFINKKWSENE